MVATLRATAAALTEGAQPAEKPPEASEKAKRGKAQVLAKRQQEIQPLKITIRRPKPSEVSSNVQSPTSPTPPPFSATPSRHKARTPDSPSTLIAFYSEISSTIISPGSVLTPSRLAEQRQSFNMTYSPSRSSSHFSPHSLARTGLLHSNELVLTVNRGKRTSDAVEISNDKGNTSLEDALSKMKPLKKQKLGKGSGPVGKLVKSSAVDKKQAEKVQKKMGRPPNPVVLLKTVQAYIIIPKAPQLGMGSKRRNGSKASPPTTNGPLTLNLDNSLDELCNCLWGFVTTTNFGKATAAGLPLSTQAGLDALVHQARSKKDPAGIIVFIYMNAPTAPCPKSAHPWELFASAAWKGADNNNDDTDIIYYGPSSSGAQNINVDKKLKPIEEEIRARWDHPGRCPEHPEVSCVQYNARHGGTWHFNLNNPPARIESWSIHAPAAPDAPASSVLTKFFKAHNLSSKLAGVLGTFGFDLDRDLSGMINYTDNLVPHGITVMDWKRFQAAHTAYNTRNNNK
ncbi:hypothetical protein BDV98DRAFT_609042 [Pterulicium gracile]|uniref:Uncharacterized protein n=1 Tax=Pterulicium gracile TaxID=1884261 RepID=A0A5C3PZK7_9AGAR|nr:hypothetical protein BDV98DRAFT_609042 [Pterula gracilis]